MRHRASPSTRSIRAVDPETFLSHRFADLHGHTRGQCETIAPNMTSSAQIFGAPTFGSQIEVLDLRHFSAAQLRPLLFDECERWESRLRWDYTNSMELLLQYLDSRVLPGFVALHGGRVIGYTFCVFEAAKAVIGDTYALGESGTLNNPVCETLLHHLIEMLQATPGVDRIESQLLMFPLGALASPYLSRGFHSFPRLFMEQDFSESKPLAPQPTLPASLKLQPWQPEFYETAAELIHRSYAGHMDSHINDQYRSAHGSLRFLHNIVRFPGCGAFDAANSWVLRDERSGRLQAMVLSSRVRSDTGHVTQLCVAPELRGFGLGRILMQQCASELERSGGTSLSLTVTEENLNARRLYDELGFRTVHRFEAMVWDGGSE
jgi:ribosomal protein S18 acetylase RimI-like enzyme